MFPEKEEAPKESAPASGEEEVVEEEAGEEKPSKETPPKKGESKGEEVTFLDPKDLPAELKPQFKRMQAAFTRKMQDLGLSARKAAAFDELVQTPSFQKWMEQQQGGGVTKGGEEEDDKPLTPVTMRKMVEEAVSKGLAPVLRNEYRSRAKAEWEGLIETYPQAESYRGEIMEALEENPKLTMEKAFKQVAFDDVAVNKVEGARKKKANTEKPSGKEELPEKVPVPKNIREAYELTKKQLAKKG